MEDLADVENIGILILQRPIRRGAGVAGDVGGNALVVPAVYVAQLLLAKVRSPGEDHIRLQHGDGLLVRGEHGIVVVHLFKASLPLVLYLVVQAVGGDDVILQPQGDHQLDAALVHADHPLRRLFVGVLHHIAGVVIVGDGDGVVVIRRLRRGLWFGIVLVSRRAVGRLRSI